MTLPLAVRRSKHETSTYAGLIQEGRRHHARAAATMLNSNTWSRKSSAVLSPSIEDVFVELIFWL